MYFLIKKLLFLYVFCCRTSISLRLESENLHCNQTCKSRGLQRVQAPVCLQRYRAWGVEGAMAVATCRLYRRGVIGLGALGSQPRQFRFWMLYPKVASRGPSGPQKMNKHCNTSSPPSAAHKHSRGAVPEPEALQPLQSPGKTACLDAEAAHSLANCNC